MVCETFFHPKAMPIAIKIIFPLILKTPYADPERNPLRCERFGERSKKIFGVLPIFVRESLKRTPIRFKNHDLKIILSKDNILTGIFRRRCQKLPEVFGKISCICLNENRDAQHLLIIQPAGIVLRILGRSLGRRAQKLKERI